MDMFLGYPSQGNVDWLERKHCFWFEAVEPNATFHMESFADPFGLNLEISVDDKKTWTRYDGYEVTLNEIGKRAYIRATDEGNETINGNYGYYTFIVNGPKIACHGNIQCLLEKYGMRDDVTNNCYEYLFGDGPFSGHGSLVSAPELPATTLADNCYQSMFNGCYSLTSAPRILPATTLASYCYDYMFYGCSSLAAAPALPATTLADNCYKNMFQGCNKISSIEVNHTAWSPENATAGWMLNAGSEVAGEKIFKCPQELIDDTTVRDDNTVPSDWTMVAK